MEQLIWNMLSKCWPNVDFNVVPAEDGQLKSFPDDEVSVIYPVLSKDFHYETIAGIRTKHSSEIFKCDNAYNHEFEGLTLARLIGSTIYFLFSANEEHEPTVNAVLQALIPKAKEIAENSQLKQFKKAVSSAIETRVKEYKDRIEENEEESQKLEQQILNLRRQIDTDTRAHKALDGTKGQWKKKAEREFAYLHRLTENLYVSIRVDGENIIAKSHNVSINYEGYEYDIGEFEIKIDLRTGDLDIKNLTHEVEDYDHPHISDGKPCLGNIGNGVIRMLTEFELFGALQIIHKFLHSYNPSSPYLKIEHWDPNYEDDNQKNYESCRDDNSGYACVECGGEDGNCPFYDEAYEVCLEHSSLDECVHCEYQCHMGRQRIQREQQKEVQAA
jgi:hypothetical protein